MTDTCHKQVMALDQNLIAVRLRLRYVEKYKERSAFQHISESDKSELIRYIGPLVQMDEKDEFAKRFDNFMYGLMLANMEKMPSLQYAKKQLRDIAQLLERKGNIPPFSVYAKSVAPKQSSAAQHTLLKFSDTVTRQAQLWRVIFSTAKILLCNSQNI